MSQELFQKGLSLVKELESHIDKMVESENMDSDEGLEHIEIINAIHDYLLRLFKQ